VRVPTWTNHHSGPTSAEVIEDIFAVHTRINDPHRSRSVTVLDLTYGRGTFWAWNWSRAIELYGADLYMTAPDMERAPTTFFSGVDFQSAAKLFGAGMFDVVVFDPPHSAVGPQSAALSTGEQWSDRYGSSRTQGVDNFQDIARMLIAGLGQALEIAREMVIVKTKPVVEAGKYRDALYLADREIYRATWHVEDRIYLAGGIPQPSGRGVEHFRGMLSTFIVAKPGVGGLSGWL